MPPTPTPANVHLGSLEIIGLQELRVVTLEWGPRPAGAGTSGFPHSPTRSWTPRPHELGKPCFPSASCLDLQPCPLPSPGGRGWGGKPLPSPSSPLPKGKSSPSPSCQCPSAMSGQRQHAGDELPVGPGWGLE